MVKRYSNNSVFIAALICIILFYSGLIKLQDRNEFKSPLAYNQLSLLEGQLISSPAKTSDQKYYWSKMKVRSCGGTLNNTAGPVKADAYGNVKVYIPSQLVEAFYPGKLYSRAAESQAGSINSIYEAGGLYCLQGRLSADGKKFYADKCLKAFFPANLYGRIDYFRALCRLQFKRLMFSWGAAGGLLLALLCAAKEYTSLEVSLSFRNAGLSHILALSGMHLSMFSGIAMFFGKRIGRKKLTFIIRIFALIIFVWFAGFSPSLLRAFICSLLMILASLANVKKPDMLLILAFSFLLQTIISPADIYNTGFILSYTALAGILLTNRLFRMLYSRFLPGFLASSLGASTGAQIFTAPISLTLFGSFAPIGIIATSVISPLVTIFIYTGLALIILCLLIPPLAHASGIFINLEYTIISFLTGIISKVPAIKLF